MSVKIKDLANELMAINGQFILGSFDELGWNMESFWSAMKTEVFNYSKFVPLQKKFNISTSGGPVYDFTYDVRNAGFEDLQNPGKPPIYLSSVVPVTTLTLLTSLGGLIAPYYKPNRELVDPRTFVYEYRNPKLYLSENGTFDVVANYDYVIKEERSDNILTDVEIEDIEKHPCYPILVRLLSGRFLISLGRARRAFTYVDMPITTDSDKLVEEGQREYDAALQALYTNQDWYNSVRP